MSNPFDKQSTSSHVDTVWHGLHRIPIDTPFAVGSVNVYVAEGNPLTLIDCAVNLPAAEQTLRTALASLGYQFKDIGRVIITHFHVDHTGLIGTIIKESGAEVWTHPYTVPYLQNFTAQRSANAYYFEDLFHAHGVPPDKIALIRQVDLYLHTLAGQANVDQIIEEGSVLSLAGMNWQAYHTPGHAIGMLCFYQPEERLLLSSDHILGAVSSNALLEPPLHEGHRRPPRLLDYLHELERMAALDIRVAFAGHGEPIHDVRGLVLSRLAFHQQRAHKLLALFEGQPCTLYELSQRMFGHRSDTELFLILSEVIGHLDLLERDGLVSHTQQNGLVYWQPTP